MVTLWAVPVAAVLLTGLVVLAATRAIAADLARIRALTDEIRDGLRSLPE